MKLIITSILSCFFFVTSLSGQFSFGFEGGINLANASDVKGLNYEHASQLYYFVGIAPKVKLGGKWAVLANVQYTQKGYRIKDAAITGDLLNRFTYLDFMPELEYSIIDALSIGLGANIGIKINENQKFGESDWLKNESLKTVKDSDFGIFGSAKFHLGDFYLLGRYFFGVSDISDLVFTDANGDPLTGTKFSNRVIQLGVGFTL